MKKKYLTPTPIKHKALLKYRQRRPVFDMVWGLTNNPSQTKKLGEILAKEVLKTKPRSEISLLRGKAEKTAQVFGLEGDLGGGKTTFLQGFARGLGIKQKILSPTFVIFKKLKLRGLKYKNFYHIDCYRIKKPKEILDLGFKEIISNPQNIVAIEWADRIREILPKGTLILKFKFITYNVRYIELNSLLIRAKEKS